MRPQVLALRKAAIQAAHSRRFPFTEFMEAHGLEEVLEEAEANNWSKKEIAGQTLFRCCVTDGKFNNFQVGFLTVMTYLNEQLGSLGTGERQAFADLAHILIHNGTLQAIAGWLDSHYR